MHAMKHFFYLGGTAFASGDNQCLYLIVSHTCLSTTFSEIKYYDMQCWSTLHSHTRQYSTMEAMIRC